MVRNFSVNMTIIIVDESYVVFKGKKTIKILLRPAQPGKIFRHMSEDRTHITISP